MSEGALIGTMEWCDDCGRSRRVEDDHIEAALSSASYSYNTTEVEYRVLNLDCGHEKSWRTGRDVTYRDGDA